MCALYKNASTVRVNSIKKKILANQKEDVSQVHLMQILLKQQLEKLSRLAYLSDK